MAQRVAEVSFDPTVNETIRAAVPAPLRSLVEASTHLGDPAVVLAIAVGYLWLSESTDHERGARVLGVVVVAFALTNVLKGIVVLDRPVEHVAFAADTYGGYSFPSGHSLGAAAVYGAIATASDWKTRTHRYSIAAAFIGIVTLSRLVLGVHYLGDVIAGVALGLGLLVLLFVTAATPGRLFAGAGLLAVVSYAFPARAFMPATLGVAVGALVGWYLIETRPIDTYGAVVLSGAVISILLGVPVLSTEVGIHWTLELTSYAIAVGAALAVSFPISQIQRPAIGKVGEYVRTIISSRSTRVVQEDKRR